MIGPPPPLFVTRAPSKESEPWVSEAPEGAKSSMLNPAYCSWLGMRRATCSASGASPDARFDSKKADARLPREDVNFCGGSVMFVLGTQATPMSRREISGELGMEAHRSAT